MRRLFAILNLLILPLIPSTAQNLYGYRFTTGVDSTKWIPLTQPVSLLGSDPNQRSTDLLNLGFSFDMFGTYATSFSLQRNGRMLLNSTNPQVNYVNPHIAECGDSNYLVPFGITNNYQTLPRTASYQLFGTPGNQILVCEVAIRVHTSDTEFSHYQIQLFEANSAIRFVYAPRTATTYGSSGQIGIVSNANKYISVYPYTHTAEANGDYMILALPWLGGWRYYEFNPFCAGITGVTVGNVDLTSARISWDTFPTHDHYLIEYRALYVGDTVHRLQSDTNTCLLPDLLEGTTYEVSVSAVCANGGTSQTVTESFTTLKLPCSNIPFTNLYPPFAECRVSNGEQADRLLVVDNDPVSVTSRHTVHRDTAERDPRTGGRLRTIPPGHCTSVRLGNWRPGAEHESITYNLHVDTLDYDLLVLRYALVEENPNHAEQENPKFILSFEDDQGNPIDSCHYADFVSGDSSGWNEGRSSSILWHDWNVVGVDLTPFHGQTLRVKLYNADCTQGGHFGYAYFTLEGATKHFSTTFCGDSVENTFRAPQGFNYRWYDAANPATTLSTADTLHVTTPAYYNCWLSYKLEGHNCGLTMSTRAGARYPVARFTVVHEDTCSAVPRFLNQSVIATDSARTRLTSEPCEKYLWRFDDGTIDSADNPVHAFAGGQHSATLVAMLANGACVDSVTDTFTVHLLSDTTHVTLCHGSRMLYYGRWIVDTGYYTHVENCFGHTLHFSWYPENVTLRNDTICVGDTLIWGPYQCTDNGLYSFTLTDHHGCDSILSLRLFCVYDHSLQISDTLPVGDMYTVGDTAFVAPGRYSFSVVTSSGCNYLCEIALSCRVRLDTMVCASALPLDWDGHLFSTEGVHTFTYPNHAGTDSIVDYALHVRPPAGLQYAVDQSCDSGGYYIVQFLDTHRHRLVSSQPDNSVEEVEAGTLYYLRPRQATRYYLYSDYADAPSCASVDSLVLDPAEMVGISLDFSYQPKKITMDNTVLTLVDHSRHLYGRQWYVDSLLLPETTPCVQTDIPAGVDSFTVCLVGYRAYCADTLCKVIPIHRYDLFFPNVFTPGEESNNRFLILGYEVEDFELWIYDRRGVLVFHTDDMEEGWDGTWNGIPCSQGAYAYICRYTIPHAQIYTHAGTVTLLR